MTALPSSEEELVLPEIPVEGPGARLRQVRQSKALEQSRIASQLHLSQTMIEALERDDYAALPGAVFTQGYLRNYARLLGVAEDEVLTAYQRLCPASEHGSLRDKRTGTIAKEVRSSHGAVQLVTWLIVIGLATLLVIWWQGRLSWVDESLTRTPVSDQSDIETPLMAEESIPAFGQTAFDGQDRPGIEGDEAPGGTDVEGHEAPGGTDVAGGTMPGASRMPEATLTPPPADRDETNMQQPVETMRMMESAPPLQEQPVTLEPVDPDIAQSTDTTLEPGATAASMQPVVAEPAIVESAVTEVAEETPITEQLVFEFSGRCWAEVRDSTGRARIIGEMRPGARRVLDAGLGPFKVVLGDASVVRLSVNGSPYDLTPHTRGKVARFTLDQVSP